MPEQSRGCEEAASLRGSRDVGTSFVSHRPFSCIHSPPSVPPHGLTSSFINPVILSASHFFCVASKKPPSLYYSQIPRLFTCATHLSYVEEDGASGVNHQSASSPRWTFCFAPDKSRLLAAGRLPCVWFHQSPSKLGIWKRSPVPVTPWV